MIKRDFFFWFLRVKRLCSHHIIHIMLFWNWSCRKIKKKTLQIEWDPQNATQPPHLKKASKPENQTTLYFTFMQGALHSAKCGGCPDQQGNVL